MIHLRLVNTILGEDRPIPRRDFLQGVLAGTASALTGWLLKGLSAPARARAGIEPSADAPAAGAPADGVAADSYVRTLLIDGARSALRTAPGKNDRMSRWALALANRSHVNVAVTALANKMPRVAWAMLKHGSHGHVATVFELAGIFDHGDECRGNQRGNSTHLLHPTYCFILAADRPNLLIELTHTLIERPQIRV
jgi:hypothetical protein